MRHGCRHRQRDTCAVEELHAGEQEVPARVGQRRCTRQDERRPGYDIQAEHAALQLGDELQPGARPGPRRIACEKL